MKAVWSGMISFGAVNIPVKLYPATEERRINFDLLRKQDLCPVGNARVCKTTGEEVAPEDIIRGYEIQRGSYVILNDKDFEQADVEKTNAIEIVDFVKENDVPSMYYEKPYYLEPQKGSEKSYILLLEALKKTRKIGIARFVLKTLEHIGAVKPEGKMLLLNQMRYESEIKMPRRLNIPKTSSIPEKHLQMAVKFINELSAPFVAAKYKDIYTKELMEIIKQKAKGRKVAPRGKAPKPTPVTELVEQLKASLEQLEKAETQRRFIRR